MTKELLSQTVDLYFDYSPLPQQEKEKLDDLRLQFKRLASWLVENTEASLEVEIALRKLQVAAMFSSKAIAHNFTKKGKQFE